MHSTFRSFLVVVSLACAVSAPTLLRAADTLQTETSMVIDRLGDGQITVTFRLSASQWTMWKQQYGDRPDVLWRDMRQQFASMDLGDFDLDKNDVERTATAKITVHGGTRRRSDGSQEIALPKDMKKISDSGRDWIFNAVAQENPYAPILNQTIRVQLPAEAQNIRLNQPGTAFQALVYDIAASGGKSNTLLYAGIAVLVVGLVLGVVGFLPGRNAATAAAG